MAPALRALARAPSLLKPSLSTAASSRALSASAARRADVAAPVRKPVGAFRGGIFGFLLGSSVAGVAVYYYILEEYRVSNTLLTEDIYALQASVQRIEAYTRGFEERVAKIERK